MSSHCAFLLIIFCLVLSSGCIQNKDISSDLTPGSDIQTPLPGDVLNQSDNVSIITPQPTVIPIAQQTIIEPTPYQTPSIPVATKATLKPDPTIVFRDQTLLLLDDLQAKKESMLNSHSEGNMIRVKEKAEEYSQALMQNSRLKEMPTKMDYVRVSYYDYSDQAGQCAQNFNEGAIRWLANDKVSANSYFDAAIIASGRADIADKRIRTFFRDYVHQVQVNQS